MIIEGHDFSSAVLSGEGDLVAASELEQPTHISALSWAARAILRKYGDDVGPGDLYLHNDPYTGGSHLNDVGLFYPVFRGDRAVAFVAVMAHWQDIGGMVPGSISGSAKDIYQEGIRIPSLRIARRGVWLHEVLELLFANVREPDDRRGDLGAMEGACRIAERRLHAMADRFGDDTVAAALAFLLARGERRMRDAIAELADGEYRYQTYLDNSGDSPEPLVLRLKLTVAGEEIHADFTGSAPQVAGPANLGPAPATTATFTMAKALLDPTGPINAGAQRPHQRDRAARHRGERAAARGVRRDRRGSARARVAGRRHARHGDARAARRRPQGRIEHHVDQRTARRAPRRVPVRRVSRRRHRRHGAWRRQQRRAQLRGRRHLLDPAGGSARSELPAARRAHGVAHRRGRTRPASRRPRPAARDPRAGRARGTLRAVGQERDPALWRARRRHRRAESLHRASRWRGDRALAPAGQDHGLRAPRRRRGGRAHGRRRRLWRCAAARSRARARRRAIRLRVGAGRSGRLRRRAARRPGGRSRHARSARASRNAARRAARAHRGRRSAPAHASCWASRPPRRERSASSTAISSTSRATMVRPCSRGHA